MSSLTIDLPENLTIVQVHAFHDELENLVSHENCDDIVINAAQVHRTDTAGLQLLLALVNYGKERHMAISWNQPSEKLKEAAEVLALSSALGLH